MYTINEMKKEAINLLKQNNIDDAVIIVNLLIEHCLNLSKEQILINKDKIVLEHEKTEFFECLNKRINKIPLEYITNKKYFMNCEFFINENVLIPRYDTEILVEYLIEILEKDLKQNEKIYVLEMCTGSGCISIGALEYLKENKKELYDRISFVCVDISEKALEVAQFNIDKYNLNNKIRLIKSDLFDSIPNMKFDIIISNPPYIETKEIDLLSDEVKKEPFIALDGGENGLYFYNEICKYAHNYLKGKGYILFEIGYKQAKDVKSILLENSFKEISVRKDLSNNDRCISGILSK